MIYGLGAGLLGKELVGRRALTRPDAEASPLPDPESLRLVRLTLDYGGGDGVDAVLLRRVEELTARAVVEGGLYRLDMPEMGAVGWARVRSVEACPPLAAGPGSLVTGWFHHWRGIVYDLRISGEAKPIRVTERHPFWSADRQDWIPMIELQPGERLLAWDGSTPVVESLSLRAEPEPVYNIEVDGDHCYRVGEQGLLVHNQSIHNNVPITTDSASRILDYASAGQSLRNRGNNRLRMGWYTFGALVYETRLDPQTRGADQGSMRIRIPESAGGLIRSTNEEGHVEMRLIQELGLTGQASACGFIVEIFDERSPCDQCDPFLDSQDVHQYHSAGASPFPVYYVAMWMPNDTMSGQRLRDAYAALGLLINPY